MPPSRRKGVLILSVGRSGTNWLKSISDATGRMGHTGEWLGFEKLAKPWKSYTAQSYYDYIIQQASTPNTRFSVKIFPRHLRHAHSCYGFDFIRKCVNEHDIKLYLVTRTDRVAQAISLLKAQQSGAWHSEHQAAKSGGRPLRYNYAQLCKNYFTISQAYGFWQTYLAAQNLPYEAFTYEDLLPDPAPFFNSTAAHLEVPAPEQLESPLQIQRDAHSADWRQRFEADMAAHGLPLSTYDLPQPAPTLTNAIKLLRGAPIKPQNGG